MSNTTIVVIRHGQTDWNVAGRWQGFTDIPLNDTGRQQALALARRLQSTHWPIDAIYSSDLSRAAETAGIVGEALHLSPKLDAAWRERGLGVLEGLTRTEIMEQFPHLALPRTFVEAPQSEPYLHVKQRVIAGFQHVVEQHRGGVAAVVSHGGTIRVLISHILELPEKLYAPFALSGNTGLSAITIGSDNQARLTLLNDTAHLEGFPAEPEE